MTRWSWESLRGLRKGMKRDFLLRGGMEERRVREMGGGRAESGDADLVVEGWVGK